MCANISGEGEVGEGERESQAGPCAALSRAQSQDCEIMTRAEIKELDT